MISTGRPNATLPLIVTRVCFTLTARSLSVQEPPQCLCETLLPLKVSQKKTLSLLRLLYHTIRQSTF